MSIKVQDAGCSRDTAASRKKGIAESELRGSVRFGSKGRKKVKATKEGKTLKQLGGEDYYAHPGESIDRKRKINVHTKTECNGAPCGRISPLEITQEHNADALKTAPLQAAYKGDTNLGCER